MTEGRWITLTSDVALGQGQIRSIEVFKASLTFSDLKQIFPDQSDFVVKSFGQLPEFAFYEKLQLCV